MAQAMKSSYHRKEQRIDARDRASATVIGHPDVTVPCSLLNISRSGMCILLNQAVESGQIVKVEWGGQFLVGKARRATVTREGFRVGLELLYCSQWNDRIGSVLSSL